MFGVSELNDKCSDTDNGIADSRDLPCSAYYPDDCGKYDTDAFQSNKRCCLCNGGEAKTLGKKN